jgi:hypothetical protein
VNQTQTIDGRVVILTTDPTNTYATQIVFPDIHNDNLNPEVPLTITITPAMTLSGAQSLAAQILALYPATPTA